MAHERTCPSCKGRNMEPFYSVRGVPVHSCLMLASEREALDVPRGDIELSFCGHCGFVSNTAFDTTIQDYSPMYEDQQSFSPTFNAFADKLAQQLIDKYGIRGKTVLEIGCGKGDFLVLMCERGNNRGIGIDPTCIRERIPASVRDRIEVIPDLYSEKYARHHGDVVMCRHTLEHIHATRDFIDTIRRAIADRSETIVFFEIPDVVIVLRDQVFWDIYYEHCSYFSPGSLARLFRASGFDVLDVYREYADQYLLIEAKPASQSTSKLHPLEEPVSQMAGFVEQFAAKVPREIERWRSSIKELHGSGKRIAIWGSGSKCVSFLTTLGLREEIGAVVDINPHRHGRFIPGAAKEVKSPEYLMEYEPDQIIIMNPIYANEIKQNLKQMGLESQVTTV
jgi:SAM-dependent methyltransferase